MFLVHGIAHQIKLLLRVAGHVPKVAAIFKKLDEDLVKSEFFVVIRGPLQSVKPTVNQLALVKMLARIND